MEINLIYKCLMNDGRIKKIKRKHILPNFKKKSFDYTQNNQTVHFFNSINSQIMDYIDNQDKKEWMIENDVYIILDYYIEKPKHKKQTFEQFAKESLIKFNFKEQLIVDFLATYVNMKESLKGLSNQKKFKLILNAMTIGYSSQSEAYKHMTKILTLPNYKSLKT